MGGDWVDLATLLEDPSVESCAIDPWQEADLVVVVASHALTVATSSGGEWVAHSAFPASICAHPVETVPVNAEELD